MKYDGEVFNLSVQAYNITDVSKANTSKEIKKKQSKLLKILLTKFKEQLKSKKNIGDGILKVRFEHRFWSDFNDGYYEINELVKSNNFNSFAREYCMYIGEIERRCDEYNTAYYEVIWDYKTYFEQLEESKERTEAKKSIKSVQRCSKLAKRELCKNNGHDWSPWKEIIGTKTITDGPHEPGERLLYQESSHQIQVPKWQRKCKNCGCTSTVEKKPAEIEVIELEEQIKELKRKIDTRKR